MNEIPVLSDTEVETSMEQNGNENLYSKVESSARISLFNLTFENSDKPQHEGVDFQNYESRLHQEMKDWKSVLHNAYKDLKKSKEKHPIVDKSILPPEKLAYLNEADCLQNFIRESVEFRQEATLFLGYDYAELMDMVENLETLCEHRLNLLKANKIAEILANIEQ